MSNQNNLDEFYRAKRTARHEKRYAPLRRKRRKKIRSRKRGYRQNGKLLSRLKNYLEIMARAGRPKIDYRPRNSSVELPSSFDLATNPTETMNAICSVCYHYMRPNILGLSIQHGDVATIGYSAEALLSFLASEVARIKRFRKQPLPRLQGDYPASERVTRMMNTAGIASNAERRKTDPEGGEGVKYFIRRSYYDRSEGYSGSDDTKTLACSDVQKYLNDCLHTIHRELTEESEVSVGSFVGEILDNAEEHADEHLWFISGYLDTGETPSKCELAIFNFGKPIHETFQDLEPGSFTRKSIQKYVTEHKSRTLTEEVLITVAALQQSISSKNKSEDDHRGSGTVEFLKFFQELIDECTDDRLKDEIKMCILSGRVQLNFDQGVKLSLDDKKRVIMSFNKDNSLDVAPDASYVRSNKGFSFPGTMISIEFPVTDSITKPK